MRGEARPGIALVGSSRSLGSLRSWWMELAGSRAGGRGSTEACRSDLGEGGGGQNGEGSGMGRGSLRSIEGVEAAGYGGGCEGEEAS